MNDSVDFLPQDAVAFLKMADGECRFPIRPVREGDFLVGSGMDCDLRLGDGLLPPLHSVLRVTPTRAYWTRLVRQPDLIINGESVQQADLNDGDLVEIGPFRMLFRLASARAEESIQRLLQADSPSLVRSALADMTAPQLVDALQNEISSLNSLTRHAADSMAELITAASELSESVAAEKRRAPIAESPRSENVSDRADLISLIQLQADRIDSISEVLEHVVRQQRVMTDVLHGLTERFSGSSAQTPPMRRASA